MRGPAFIQKIIENPEYLGLVFLASVLDARSTTMSVSEASVKEMNPLMAYLINNLPASSLEPVMILLPILFSLYIFHLWATPSKRILGFYAINTIILSKTVAGINNLMIGQGIYHPILTTTVILSILLPLTIGFWKQSQKYKEEKRNKELIGNLPNPKLLDDEH